MKQAGVSIQRIVPGLQTMDIRVDDYFSTVHPEVTLTIPNVRKFINSQFVLRTKREMMPEAWKQRPMLELRGIYIFSLPVQNLTINKWMPLHILDTETHTVRLQ